MLPVRVTEADTVSADTGSRQAARQIASARRISDLLKSFMADYPGTDGRLITDEDVKESNTVYCIYVLYHNSVNSGNEIFSPNGERNI